MRTVVVSSEGTRMTSLRTAARTLLLAGLAGICMAAWAATPESDHAVGTLARVDMGQSRIVLSRDSETGNAVGQGTPDNIYLSPSTVITRSGGPVHLTDLKVGERLLVATQRSGNRTEGSRVRVLPSTSPGQDWGRYLHGTLRSIEKATRSVHIDQAQTLNFVRIRYDDNTQAFDAEGKPIQLSSLKPGDELDMAVRKDVKDRTATKVVLLPPHGGP